MRLVWWHKRGDTEQQASRDNSQSHRPARRFHPLVLLLIIFSLLAGAHFVAVTYNTSITAQSASSCSTYLHRLDYTKVIPLHAGQNMDAVQFIDDIVGGQPATLLEINTTTGTQQTLDVYVYGCALTDNTPELRLLLEQQGLSQGVVSITAAHTLSIGQVDTTLAANTDATLLLPQQQNVYREYAWQDGALRQVLFPGLYPVTSRSEAEALQEEADHNPMIPWNDPLGTAEQMTQDLLHWKNSDIQATIRDSSMTDAHIQIIRKDIHAQILVSLSRLIRHDSSGLWFVTNVETPGITLDQSQFATVLPSPISIHGTTTPITEPIKISLFDHAFNSLHIMNNTAIPVDGNGVFTGNITYSGVFPDQTALLLVQSEPGPGSNDSAVIYLTNLLLR